MKQISHYFLIGLLITTLQFVHNNVCAQSIFSSSEGAIGLSYGGLGSNDAIYSSDIIGGGDYTSNGYYSIGITYLRAITSRIELETGVSYNKYNYLFSNASLGPDGPAPYEVLNTVIDIPVTIRWIFLKYFFLNGGLSIGIDTKKENHLDSQTGIGAIIGVGAKYDIKRTPVGLFVNPYSKIHSLIPFQKEGYHQRALENGFRFGVVYYVR